MSQKTDYDLIIVGAGMAGASLALALQNQPVRVALIESRSLQTHEQPGFDDRAIALAYGSQRILQSMGLWTSLASAATPIEQIHVSDRGHFGTTRLTASQHDVPALGQVVTASHFGRVLNQALQAADNLDIFSPDSVTDFQTQPDQVQVRLKTGQQISARLLVAADGAQSAIRQLSQTPTRQTHYQQVAITTNVVTERPHQNHAYERFTNTGPMALLPMSEKRSSLVWTVRPGEEDALLNCNMATFLQQLQARFGWRLGAFEYAGKRSSYPLSLLQAEPTETDRLALIGNAAHSLHPIAGQGFNLGLRDVAVLAELIAAHPDDCGHPALTQTYQMQRRGDHRQAICATHSLVRLFSNSNPLLGHARALGLTLLDILPLLKNQLGRQSMGLAGRQPRLMRGLPL